MVGHRLREGVRRVAYADAAGLGGGPIDGVDAGAPLGDDAQARRGGEYVAGEVIVAADDTVHVPHQR